MVKTSLTHVKRGLFLFASLLIVLAAVPTGGFVSASITNSIYSYTLDGSSSTVSNDAAANSGVDLTLSGDWTQSDFGVHFDGNTTDAMSVGYANPATGDTLNVSASSSVGLTAKFKFEGPGVNNQCFADSHNITQIGRFGDDLSQVKIQTSNCFDVDWAVFPECRFAGENSSTADLPFRSSQPLIDGQTYIVRCYKQPDPVSGNATATIDVTQVNGEYGNRTTSDQASITPTGDIQSTAYLSVANKYQLPAQNANTDQFVGDISKVAFCQATTAAAVKTCLEAENPDPTDGSLTREWVTNPGVETDFTQWTGRYGESPYVDVSRSTDQAHTGSYSVKVLGLTGANNLKSGLADGDPKLVTNVTAGEVYNASVWVKPGAVGEKINLRLREWNNNTLITDNKVTLTPSSTDWQEMTNTITGVQNDNRLSFAVYGEDVDAGKVFYIDDMSLESTLIDHEWVVNTGVDSNMNGWNDIFSSSPYVTVAHSTAQAHTGAGSVKVTALTGASDLSTGFATEDWLATEKVEAGKTYKGAVWVKASAIGQEVVLRLREQTWNGVSPDLHNQVKVVHTATSTGWEKVEATATAGVDGSGFEFIVHGKSLNAGEHFYADDFSFTSLE